MSVKQSALHYGTADLTAASQIAKGGTRCRQSIKVAFAQEYKFPLLFLNATDFRAPFHSRLPFAQHVTVMHLVVAFSLYHKGFVCCDDKEVGMIGGHQTWARNAEKKSMRQQLEVDFVVNKGAERIYPICLPHADRREVDAREKATA